MRNCKTCKYGKRNRYYVSKDCMYFCDYLAMTGHRRNCPAKNCEKYEKLTQPHISHFTTGGISK